MTSNLIDRVVTRRIKHQPKADNISNSDLNANIYKCNEKADKVILIDYFYTDKKLPE